MRPPPPAWAPGVLLRAFRGLALVVEDDGEGGFLPDMAALQRWMRAWDRWFRAESGIAQGDHLHMQYRRDAVIVTDLSADALLAMRPAGDTCRELGIGFSASVLLDDALARRDAVIDGLAGGWLHAATLVATGPVPGAAALEALIAPLIDMGVQIRLAGDPAAFLQSGILDAPLLNARNLTIEPRGPGAMPPPDRPAPCLPLMRLYVDATGDIYPCLGLLGTAQGRLGHIDDVARGAPFAPRSGLDLQTLALAGPAEEDCAAPARSFGLPERCARHRAGLAARDA